MVSRFESFRRTQWAELREATPLTLTTNDLDQIRGISDRLDLDEVSNVYLPLSRLLNLHIRATQGLSDVTDTFLGTSFNNVPYVIGVAGSVAVGKSTTSRLLRTLLSHWPDHRHVELLTTDGFLLPNAELEGRGLMNRKGFPESYDTASLIDFLKAIKSGERFVDAPVYSHIAYDVVPDKRVVFDLPDVLIVEGLNVLQGSTGEQSVVVSDFFDFSIFVDADEHDIEQWYVERFLKLRQSVFQSSDSYFQHYRQLDDEQATAVARGIWSRINSPNLRENIAPTRERANLILRKGPNHAVEEVRLRKT